MRREFSPRGQRRGRYNEAGIDKLPDSNSQNDTDNNMEYTSTPLKMNRANIIRRQSSAPNLDSEESTDAVKGREKPSRRRKSSKSIIGKGRASRTKMNDPIDRRENKRHRSRRRRSERSKNYLQNGGDREDFEEIGMKRREAESPELPIADILRKAQESQAQSLPTRYEDPLPQPQLTTDTLYVQGRNGFSAVKIGNPRNSERSSTDVLLRPIHIAIKIHNFSKNLMLVCQGLLGGIALGQVILVTRTEIDSNDLTEIIFTSYSHLMSGIFLFLVTMSLLASMDRIDLANLNGEHVSEIIYHRSMTMITFPLYLVALCIHLGVVNIDENLRTVGQESEISNATEEDLGHAARRQTNTWKFTLCIIAWFFIAVGPSDDSTTTHLEAMQKYAT